MCRRLWLTTRPGIVSSRLATVAAAVRRRGWGACARRAVQRAMLWAKAAQARWAALAQKLPEGQCASPLALRSRMASSTLAWARWQVVGGGGVEVVSVGDEAVAPPVGPQLALGAFEAGAAHHEAQCAGAFGVAPSGCDGGLRDLCCAVFGVGDRRPGLLVDGVYGCCDLGVLCDRDRVARVVRVEALDHVIGEEPRIGAHRHRRFAREAAQPREGLRHEPQVAALGGPRAHPHMHHLAGVVTHRDHRVIAQHFGVAIGGAAFGGAADLTDRGVQIHRHLRHRGRRADRPRPPQGKLAGSVELADMAPREGPQPRPQSRGRQRPERQHRTSGAGPQPVGVADERPAHQHRRRHRQRLGPRPAARPRRAHRRVDEPLEAQPAHHRARQQQAPRRPPKTRRRNEPPTRRSHPACCSQEGPPHMTRKRVIANSILPCQEALLVDAPTPSTPPLRWIQA